jgi:hypothetical protein
MDARERAYLYEAYKQDCRQMAYLYVELILQVIAELPIDRFDTVITCQRPQVLFPGRAHYPRYRDLFRHVALLLVEKKYSVKWKADRAPFLYVRWGNTDDAVTEIDSVGEVKPPVDFRPRAPEARRTLDFSDMQTGVAPVSPVELDGLSLPSTNDTGWLEKLKQLNKK